nr:hypothetical protein [Methanoculleus marisnigri]
MNHLQVGKTNRHKHLKALAKARIVDLVPGTGRGRKRVVRPRYDPDDVTVTCSRSKTPD